MYQQVFTLHAALLQALSHPKRLEIIHLLREQRLSVNEIKDMLGLPQANLSQHLMVLRDAGVLSTEKNGKQVYYSLADKNFIKASDLLREVLVKRYENDKLADEFTKKMSELVPLVHDPVCDMRLSPKTAGFVYKHDHKDYYFCASGCQQSFKKNPQKYLKNKQ